MKYAKTDKTNEDALSLTPRIGRGGTRPSTYLVISTATFLVERGIVAVASEDDFWRLCHKTIPYLKTIDSKLGKD